MSADALATARLRSARLTFEDGAILTRRSLFAYQYSCEAASAQSCTLAQMTPEYGLCLTPIQHCR